MSSASGVSGVGGIGVGVYDYIIVGAGIAGLYSAYLIKKRTPGSKILILEKESYIGGRAYNAMFEGVNVVCGAGVGRKEKDILLQELIKDLHVKYNEFPAKHSYASGVSHQMDFWFNSLHKVAKQIPPWPRMNFKHFATQVIGVKDYPKFVVASGYSDFELADSNDVMNFYGMDDNFKPWTAIGIDWKVLGETLTKYIGRRHIKLNMPVHKITPENDDGIIKVQCGHGSGGGGGGGVFKTRKCIVAADIDALRKLFPKERVYSEIKSQPFLRIYAKFSQETSAVLGTKVHGLIVVNGPLQEIIPMDPGKGVYMIAYSDNASAKKLHKIQKLDKEEQYRYFEKTVAKALNIPSHLLINGISALQYHYWPIGTHYNKVLRKQYADRYEFVEKAQHPMPGVYVVGEVVALHQGWVEGALESVNEIRGVL